MKNTGSFLTLIGGVLMVVTVVKISNEIKNYNNGTSQPNNNTNNNGDSNIEATLLGGLAGLGAGIPLWIVGAHSQRKYENKLQNLYVGFNVNPNQTGITLKYKF